ncbi:MAG: twin-arginine translocation signal domain-containing protein, partial [Verrucomicrobiota bacterium]|nr:twin-arginine translocation signal domain-containing protein [Verrucomicrobiota bacterium]
MNTEQFLTRLNRRSFLSNASLGVGSLALTSMLGPGGLAKP